MPEVKIISSTPNAAEVLIFSKQTRLNLSTGLMQEIMDWSPEKKVAELDYMSKTIKSSWEMVDIIFLLTGVTRACAQQITRSRNASYAMQSQRVTNAMQIPVSNPFDIKQSNHAYFESCVEQIKEMYDSMLVEGAKFEDARGILPMNTQCNILAKYNLRSLSEVIKARKSLRAQGEYHDIALQMEQRVIEIWPWAVPFFVSDKQIAIEMLEKIAKEIGVEVGFGKGWEISKAVDLIRKN